jgi:hypothetical protein
MFICRRGDNAHRQKQWSYHGIQSRSIGYRARFLDAKHQGYPVGPRGPAGSESFGSHLVVQPGQGSIRAGSGRVVAVLLRRAAVLPETGRRLAG